MRKIRNTDRSRVEGKSKVTPSLVSSRTMLLQTAVGSSNLFRPEICTPLRLRSQTAMLWEGKCAALTN